ncbi:MAG TPA: alkaline phosphatase family protein [Ohtaekwangia sp.]
MKKIILFLSLLLIAVSGWSQKLKTENVFIITLDGFRWQELFTGADTGLITNKDYSKDPLGSKARFGAKTAEQRRELLLPFFWNTIAKQGQLYGNRLYNNKVNCSNNMWFSYPGYNEILCGFPDDARIRSNNKFENPNVTVLEFLNRLPEFQGRVAAFGSWDVFPFIINEQRSGVPVNAGLEMADGSTLSEREKFLNELQSQVPVLWGGVRMDGFTHQFAVEYILKNKPKVVYISYGETDDFAHDGKYDIYLRSANQTDKFIAELWDLIQSDSDYRDKTTFILTTDHGRGTVPVDNWRSHGTEIPGADQIWFAVLGPDTEPKGELKTNGQYYQKQVAKTAAAFLGVQYTNEKPVGDVVEPMFRSK